jgi:hypothetical protein
LSSTENVEEIFIRRLERQYESAIRAVSIANAELNYLEAQLPAESAILRRIRQRVEDLRKKRDRLRSALEMPQMAGVAEPTDR